MKSANNDYGEKGGAATYGTSVGRDSRESTWTGYSMYCAVAASLASFMNGYNVGAPNAPEMVIRSCEGVQESQKLGMFVGCIPMSSSIWGFAIGSFALGGLAGGLSASPVMNTLGRKKTLLFNTIIFVIGSLLMALSTTSAQFIAGRIVVGIASGVGTVVGPVYVGEVASIKWRGIFGTLVQLNMVLGILAAQLLGLVLSNSPGWRILFVIPVIPAVLQAVLLPFCTETPAFLATHQQLDAAALALSRLRHGFNTRAEFEMLTHGQQDSGVSGKLRQGDADAPMTVLQLLGSPMRKLVIVAVVVHALQQLTGINSIFFYSTGMFSKVFSPSAARGVTVGIGVLNVAMTFVTSACVERAGRKVLLLGSIIGMTLMSVVVVVANMFKQDVILIVAVFLFVASFAVGLGPVPWMLVPELFPTKAVGAASTLALGTNWLCNFCVGLLFPLINEGLKSYSFSVFVATGALGTVFLWTQLVETKGKTVEQIHVEMLGDRANI